MSKPKFRVVKNTQGNYDVLLRQAAPNRYVRIRTFGSHYPAKRFVRDYYRDFRVA